MKFHMITMLSIFLDIVAEAWSGILLSVQFNTICFGKNTQLLGPFCLLSCLYELFVSQPHGCLGEALKD